MHTQTLNNSNVTYVHFACMLSGQCMILKHTQFDSNTLHINITTICYSVAHYNADNVDGWPPRKRQSIQATQSRQCTASTCSGIDCFHCIACIDCGFCGGPEGMIPRNRTAGVIVTLMQLLK